MKRGNWTRALTMGAALWLAAALLLGGCRTVGDEKSGNEPAESAQGAEPSGESTGDVEANKPDAGAANIRGNSPGNLLNGGVAAGQGDWIYFRGSDGIYKMKSDGSKIDRICDAKKASYINVSGEWLYYWIDNTGTYKIKTNGKDQTLLFEKNGENLSVIGDWIYAFDADDDGVSRFRGVTKDGTDSFKASAEKLTVGYGMNMLIGEDVVIGEKLSADTPTDIYLYKKDGSFLSVDNDILQGEYNNARYGIVGIRDSWIYVAVSGTYSQGLDVVTNYELVRIAMDGSIAEAFRELTKIEYDYLNKANVADEWVYYANPEDDDSIYRERLQGQEKTKVGDDAASNINVVGDWIFYKCTEDSQWYRIRTDGTERTPLE
ncbi:MAG TPA: DUF5050 domain-containing protein [Clostridia bacterium]|nr:DUF5050 domain-containing protein [Clostridia bacterium]